MNKIENNPVKNFLYFLNHYKALTWKQQTKRDELLALTIVKQESIITQKNNGGHFDTIHDPKYVASLLHLFTEEKSYLKYATHIWDTRSNEGDSHFSGYDDFIDKIKSQLKERGFTRGKEGHRNLYSHNKDLYYLIEKFLLEDNIEENYGWGEDKIRIGYSCPSKNGLKDWMEKNPNAQPGDMPISEFPEALRPEKVGGKVPSTFKDVINAFKSSIEFRDSSLYYAFKKIFHSSNYTVSKEDLNKLKGVSFYTNTYAFKEALRIVASNIDARTEYTKVGIDVENSDDYVEITICHKKSFSDKDVNDSKLQLKGGQMKDIRDKLVSLCDFSVESRFKEKGKQGYYQIQYLYTKNASAKPQIDKIKSCDGFVYRFKFYKG